MSKKTNQKDICQIICFNKAKVTKIKKTILSQQKLNSLVEIFKAISDNTRTKILLALREGELCVCDISHVLGLSLSAVSHQLRILRGLRLVKYRSEGKMVFYSLTDKHIIKLIEEGIKHIKKG
jgi:DNA-binding transcriptional ArsR family regulator